MRTRFEERLRVRLFPVAKILLLIAALIFLLIFVSVVKNDDNVITSSILLHLTFWISFILLIIAIRKQINMVTKEELEIKSLDIPIARIIREQLESMVQSKRTTLIGDLTVDEFIEERTEIYLDAYRDAVQSGNYSESGSREIALKAATEGIELA